MSVVGETRVLPEDLAQTAARLRPIFERLAKTTLSRRGTKHAEQTKLFSAISCAFVADVSR